MGQSARPLCPGGSGEQPRRRAAVRAHPPGTLRCGAGAGAGGPQGLLSRVHTRGRARATPSPTPTPAHTGTTHRAPAQDAAWRWAPSRPSWTAYLKEHGGEVDYIHGDAVADELGSKPGNIGFKLPAMGKEQLFKTVMADGVLPRRPSPWATPRTSGTMWRPGRSSNGEALLES